MVTWSNFQMLSPGFDTLTNLAFSQNNVRRARPRP